MHFWGSGANNMNRKRTKISSIVIAKNESGRIGECLNSLKWTDEVIVVDNNSTDQTAGIAKSNGARVYSFKSSDFSQLRNFGKDKATFDWLLYVDADEIVSPRLKEEVLSLVKNHNQNADIHCYYLRRRNYYLGKRWPVYDQIQRLFWKPAFVGWTGKLHESAITKGSTGVLREPLIHNTHRSLEEMVMKTNQWSAIEAHLRLQALHPPVVWWRLLRVMWTGFSNSFFSQGGWRAGTVGWIESIYQGFSMFITYAKLWERQQKSSSQSSLSR